MTPLLDANRVSIARRLEPADLTASSGQMIALIGPNGGGKTSLLRALARVDGAGGTVTIEGEDLDRAGEARRRRLVGLLPASHDSAWPIPVRDFLALGGATPDAVQRELERFELALLAERPISACSTGERSRAMIARVIAARPRLLLLDEPLSNLDPYWVLTVLGVLRETLAETGAVALVSLHDLSHLPAFDLAAIVAGGSLGAAKPPLKILESDEFEKSFRVRWDSGKAVLRPADRQSSR